MSYTLFLDDIRFPGDVRYDYGPYKDIIICRNVDDAIWTVQQRGIPSFISFDHDLGDDHPVMESTGYTFAKLLCSYIMDRNLVLPDKFGYYVHSMNPVGARNIQAYMDNFVKHWRLQ